jgi:PAS domain S-box-containing protein
MKGLAEEVLEWMSHGLIVWRSEDRNDENSLRLLYLNSTAERLLGKRREDCVGRLYFDIFPTASRDRMHIYRQVALGRQPRDLGLVQVPPHSLWVTAYPVLTDAVAIFFENQSDVAASARRERQLRQFLDQLLENIPAMVFVKDAADLKFERFNRAGEELLGIPREELIGKSDYDFFPPEQAEFFIEKDREVLANGKLQDIAEEPIETPRGRRWLHTRKIPLLDDDGKPAHLLGLSMDITASRAAHEMRRELVAALEAENRRVLEATRVKSEFLASMSHELRTPLNAIIGFAEVLADDRKHPLASHQRDFLGDILASGKHLLRLISDVLDLSKVEAGRIEIYPTRVDLCALAEEVKHTLRLSAQAKQIAVSCVVDVREAIVDEHRLKQVLYNYLSNALKFTPLGGRVTLRIRPEGEDHFCLEVEDTGIGIAQADLARLFVEFEQLDTGAGKQYGGTGLGLALTKRIVEAQGGTVDVRSAPGVGSVFRAIFPLKPHT